MAESTISPPAEQQQSKETSSGPGCDAVAPPPEIVTIKPRAMQLVGDDTRTKSLMNRMATGQATQQERTEFFRHVTEATWLNSIPSTSASTSTSAQNEQGSPIPIRSSESDTALPDEHGRPWSIPSQPDSSPKRESSKHQNRTPLSVGQDNSEETMEETLNQKRQVLIQKEQQEMKFGTIDSTWERDRTRLLDVHPSNWMPYERSNFRKMWKRHVASQNKLPKFGWGPKIQDEPTHKKVEFAPGPPSTISDKKAPETKRATRDNAAKYAQPFCDFMAHNPTVYHAVAGLKKQLKEAGWTELSERKKWDLKPKGGYFLERNGTSLIAFSVGAKYEPGNGTAIVAGHVDALTAKLKPIAQLPNKAGFVQIGVAPYGGGLNNTWWDRDLGVAGRVLVKEDDKIVSKLVKLDWPIARIPSLAVHFGRAADGPFNLETQMVPIVGLESPGSAKYPEMELDEFRNPPLIGGASSDSSSFVNTQPPALVKAIGSALGMSVNTYTNIVNWELELFDVQPATVGGLNKDFIYAGRLDDKLCSWAAMQALIESHDTDNADSSMIKVAGVFDNEEIGSLTRQGARGNFLPVTLERAVGCLCKRPIGPNMMGRTYANSFLVSSDVTHAVNPNFLNAYLENHAPHLNVGVAVSADSNGHMTTDAVSTAIFKRCVDQVGAKLQVFQIRNDSRSGGTVGPMLSAMTGVRAIDAGIPQLSMHSIRATTGSLDPGLGVITFLGFYNGFEKVDKEFTT